jgi:hypothetical protein
MASVQLIGFDVGTGCRDADVVLLTDNLCSGVELLQVINDGVLNMDICFCKNVIRAAI